MLGEHSFSQALHHDLHPFGCYVIGHLPRESPEVTDTTHSDSGLEGAFLGWDITTLTVWIWSFRRKEPVRMHDPVFYWSKLPFSDPSVLLNRDITVQEIARMRETDPVDGFTVDDLVQDGSSSRQSEMDMGAQLGTDGVTTQADELSQASTQPAAASVPEPVTRPSGDSWFTNPFPRSATDELKGPITWLRAAESSAKCDTAPGDLTAQPQDSGESLRDPHENAQLERRMDPRDPRTWSSGADFPLTASLSTMTDKQLGRALAHHKFVFRLLKEWWHNQHTDRYESCTAVASDVVKVNQHYYLNCTIVSPGPAKRVAHTLQFPLSSHGSFTKWHVRRFLDACFNKPQTLEDLGLKELPGQKG
eukprot:1465982-Rhodomonas_salina.1